MLFVIWIICNWVCLHVRRAHNSNRSASKEIAIKGSSSRYTYQKRYFELHNLNSSCAKAKAIFVYQVKLSPSKEAQNDFTHNSRRISEANFGGLSEKSLLSFCFYHLTWKPSLVPVWTNQSKRVLIPLSDSTCASKVLPLSTKSFGIRRALREAKICLLTRMHMRNYPRLALWGNSLWSLVDVAPGAIVIVAYRHTSFE